MHSNWFVLLYNATKRANVRIYFSALALLPLALPAEDTLRIAVKNAPPFVILDDQNAPQGPIVDFWERIDRELGWHSEYVVFNDVNSILNAVESGEVDMSVNPITVTADRLQKVDFTQPFFITSTVVVRAKSSPFLSMLKGIFTWRFLSAIGGLALIILLFGFVVWVVEHRHNKEFRKGYKGIGDGFWWSAVTMTTVGYGDKAPKTVVGRVIAFLWMIVAVVGISGLTAGIASSLTTQNFESDIQTVHDLRQYTIATVKETSPSAYLEQFSIPAIETVDVKSGLDLLLSGQVEMFIYDRVMVEHVLRENPVYSDLEIAPTHLRTDYYSFPVSKKAQLLSKINPPLVHQLNGLDWIAIKNQYGLE